MNIFLMAGLKITNNSKMLMKFIFVSGSFQVTHSITKEQ
jgi:hypothetical protein